jgi:hypothetical protein
LKTSARALLALGALLVFLIGLALVLLFAPRDGASPAVESPPPDADGLLKH